MGFLRKKWLLFVLVTGQVAYSGALRAEECVNWYQRLARGTVAAPGKVGRWIANQQKEYWRDVGATRGLRLLLAKRAEPEKFHTMFFLFDDPYSEVGNVVKHKILKGKPIQRRVAIPASIAASIATPYYFVPWNYFYEHLEEYIADKKLQKVFAQEKDNPASSYLIQLWQLGLMEPDDMLSAMKSYTKELNAFLSGKKNTAIDKRITSLNKTGALSDKDVERFTALLRKEINRVVRLHEQKKKTELSVVEDLQITIRDQLKKEFSHLSDNDRELLMFAMLPEVKVFGKSDLELAKESLSSKVFAPIAEELGVPYALAIAGRSGAERDGLVAEKKKRALKIPEIAKLPLEKKRFLERVDIPPYGNKFELSELKGNKKIMKDELDRWQTFLSDPRFTDYAQLWLGGRVSDIGAMRVFEWVSNAHNKFYDLARAHPEATADDVCGVVNGEPYEALFTTVDAVLDEVQKSVSFQGNQRASCKEDLIKLQWQFNIEQAKANWQISEAQAQLMNKRVLDLVNQSCFTEKAKSFVSSCKKK